MPPPSALYPMKALRECCKTNAFASSLAKSYLSLWAPDLSTSQRTQIRSCQVSFIRLFRLSQSCFLLTSCSSVLIYLWWHSYSIFCYFLIFYVTFYIDFMFILVLSSVWCNLCALSSAYNLLFIWSFYCWSIYSVCRLWTVFSLFVMFRLHLKFVCHCFLWIV